MKAENNLAMMMMMMKMKQKSQTTTVLPSHKQTFYFSYKTKQESQLAGHFWIASPPWKSSPIQDYLLRFRTQNTKNFEVPSTEQQQI